LTPDGAFINVFRDDSSASAFTIAPRSDWTPLGEAVTRVDWVTVSRHVASWVVEAGPGGDCFCTWPVLDWAGQGGLGESTQLLLDGLPPITFEGPATTSFDESDSCVIVHPAGDWAREIFDLTSGVRTKIDGFDSLFWVTGEGRTYAF
jgi:hypothetical protein